MSIRLQTVIVLSLTFITTTASARIGRNLTEGVNTFGPLKFDEANGVGSFRSLPIYGDDLIDSDLFLDRVVIQVSDFSPGPNNDFEIVFNASNVVSDFAISNNGTFVIDEISNRSASSYSYQINLAGDITGASGTVQLDYIVVPEPSSLALLGIGGLALMRRRRS